MIAARWMPGAISFSNSSHLPPIPASMLINPVRFPLGRARFATKPAPTGSEMPTNTTGIAGASYWNAAVTGVDVATKTSGFGIMHAVRHQSTCIDEFARHKDGRQLMLGRELDDELLICLCERIDGDQERVDALLACAVERRHDVGGCPHVEQVGFDAHDRRRFLELFPNGARRRVAHVRDRANARETGNHLFD